MIRMSDGRVTVQTWHGVLPCRRGRWLWSKAQAPGAEVILMPVALGAQLIQPGGQHRSVDV